MGARWRNHSVLNRQDIVFDLGQKPTLGITFLDCRAPIANDTCIPGLGIL
jgi:hypothetical protein